MDPLLARAVLARRKAQSATSDETAERMQAAARLRSIFYDKQRAFFRSPHKRKATKKTRRAGATTGGCSELLARALTLEGHKAEQGFRASIGHNTRVEAKARAWRNDTKSGIVDVLSQHGKRVPEAQIESYVIGGVTVEVREAELALNFSNGSRIDLFGCDSESDLGKLRSNAKHVVWIDEAQDPRWVALLADLYKGTIVGMADYRVETWITGTPGKDPAGMFFDITRDDAPGLPGWEVHAMSVVDNPYFGATPEERWAETAEKALVENGWTVEDPDFQREWMARWVMSDARFVYAANSVPIHELLYAPARFRPDGFPDLRAAMADLPGYRDGRDYFLGMGNDLGVYAFSVRAWSLQDPCLYEVASYKKRGLDYDDMFEIIKAVRETLGIGLTVADAGGGGKQAVMGWSKKLVERYGVPLIEAKKTNKHTAQDQYNNDLRKRLLKYRGTPEKPSPLLQELLTHRWAPVRSSTGKLVESTETDNHCCFVAGTMIELERGSVPIEFVRVGDRAWTRNGLRNVTAAWCSGVKLVSRLEAERGVLVGTPDHLIWADDDWKPLANLTPDIMVSVWERTDQVLEWNGTGPSTVGIQSQVDENCESTGTRNAAIGSIAISGSFTTDPFRSVSTFITRITTRWITALRTWSASLGQSTCPSTCESPMSSNAPSGTFSSSPSPRQLSGIAPQKGVSGTSSTANVSRRGASSLLANAWSVVGRFVQRFQARKCVATTVTPNGAVILGSITSNAPARNAKTRTSAIATQSRSIVRSRVLRVQPTGVALPVYNLTVDVDHEYFANGILVSNCDADLYIHRESHHHRFREPPPPPPAKGSVEYLKREEAELEAAMEEDDE